jgi:zinc transporter ZupT
MSFIAELCRRNVFKVGAVYASSAWLLIQILELVLANTNAPDWVMSAFVLAFAAGLPLVLIAAWLLELTPNGIRFVKNVEPGESISSMTGRQLTRGIIMILAMAIVLFLTDRFRDELWFTPGTNDTDIEAPSSDERDGSMPDKQSQTEPDKASPEGNG